MLNFNGELFDDDIKFLDVNNRGLQLGDAVFEEIRVVNREVFFLEEHYLRLMSSMRILRMDIPMSFTMEFMEEEILKVISEAKSNKSYRIKFNVFRNNTGDYTLSDNSISYIISKAELEKSFYTIEENPYEVELYKDFYKNSSMISNLDTNNKVLNVVGAIYANENDYQDCLLLNERKQVVESLNGNVFLVHDKIIKTPPLTDGCLNGILRRKLMDIISKSDEFQLLEESISPFELQKADEMFIVDNIFGIIPITKYRKKNFSNSVSKSLIGKLNAAARLSLNKAT